YERMSAAPSAQRPSCACHARPKSQERRYHSQRCLHRKAALVAGLPLSQEASVIQQQSRGLLGNIDVERGPREQRGGNQRKQFGNHLGAPQNIWGGLPRDCEGAKHGWIAPIVP